MHVSNESIKQIARECGFSLCGVCEALASDYGDQLRGWLAAGKHGEMGWLAENVETRLDPRKLLEGAKSVVVVVDLLAKSEEKGVKMEEKGGELEAKSVGKVARYAQVSDYHRVMKKRLLGMCDELRARWPAENFRACVDTAPLMEREHAQRAGLGWTGKHTLLLNDEFGSHMMLGAIVTTLEIATDTPGMDHCGTCTRCIDACPTEAITPYSVDATRCISYLTIEHRSEIDAKLHESMGDWVFGCDVCQEVCPYVKRAKAPPAPARGYQRHRATLDVMEVLEWSEEDRRAAFASSAMKRAKLDMIRRNALIVAGNYLKEHEDAELRRRIQRIAEDANEPEMIRRTAGGLLHRANRGQ